ncbi:WD40-repeat-containing domain protein, partial [Pisolithus marmoratus]
DLDTRATVRWCEGHVKGLTTVEYARLILPSKDWKIIIWDLPSPCDPAPRHTTIRFDAPVVAASFQPRHSRVVLTLLSTGEACTIDLRSSHRSRFKLDGEDDSDDKRYVNKRLCRTIMTTIRFDPTGRHVFVGTSAGTIEVYNTRTKSATRHRILGAGVIKRLVFAMGGRRFATNSSDRTIRQFTLPTYPPLPEPSTTGSIKCQTVERELEPTHRFNDPISKVAWRAISYSPDRERLAGGAADPAAHRIYVSDISNDGQFASALDGGREPLLDVHWHPHGPPPASTTKDGNILIWHCPSPTKMFVTRREKASSI